MITANNDSWIWAFHCTYNTNAPGQDCFSKLSVSFKNKEHFAETAEDEGLKNRYFPGEPIFRNVTNHKHFISFPSNKNIVNSIWPIIIMITAKLKRIWLKIPIIAVSFLVFHDHWKCQKLVKNLYLNVISFWKVANSAFKATMGRICFFYLQNMWKTKWKTKFKMLSSQLN